MSGPEHAGGFIFRSGLASTTARTITLKRQPYYAAYRPQSQSMLFQRLDYCSVQRGRLRAAHRAWSTLNFKSTNSTFEASVNINTRFRSLLSH
jgi:hypothetical protein